MAAVQVQHKLHYSWEAVYPYICFRDKSTRLLLCTPADTEAAMQAWQAGPQRHVPCKLQMPHMNTNNKFTLYICRRRECGIKHLALQLPLPLARKVPGAASAGVPADRLLAHTRAVATNAPGTALPGFCASLPRLSACRPGPASRNQCAVHNTVRLRSAALQAMLRPATELPECAARDIRAGLERTLYWHGLTARNANAAPVAAAANWPYLLTYHAPRVVVAPAGQALVGGTAGMRGVACRALEHALGGLGESTAGVAAAVQRQQTPSVNS